LEREQFDNWNGNSLIRLIHETDDDERQLTVPYIKGTKNRKQREKERTKRQKKIK
jgi:hypothetical protein